MVFFQICWYSLQVLIGYNLILPGILAFINIFKKKTSFVTSSNINEADYAIIITAYEETDLLKDVIKSISNLNYSNYIAYIVADNCDVSNLSFNNNKVILLRPDTVLSSNTASHLYAIDKFTRKHERLTIIDSDNLVDKNYLNELNIYFEKGYVAVQGIRKAKNLNSVLACLDAARDMYYHYFDGNLLFNLGSSATLSGSGMGFTVDFYKKFLTNNKVIGAGFDKVLQYTIVSSGLRIAFSKNAIVFDEKTAHPSQLINQRTRWINTWFKYFYYGFDLILLGIRKLKVNEFLFGLILVRPPLFIFISFSIIMLIINIFLSTTIAILWICSIAIFVACFIAAMIENNADILIYRSFFNIPEFVYFQILALLKIKRREKISIATKHYFNRELDHK